MESGSNAAQGDLFNTAAGWVLFAAGLGLGLSILSGKYFHANNPERPETLGYIIEGVEEEAGAVKMTMAEALNMDGVDVSAGEKVFAKCAACHSVEQGGPNGVGPNLYGVMGAQFGANGAFGYSSALTGAGGTWGWEEMNDWLANPRGYIDGTSMGFAGLSKIEDRAALALYLNTYGSNLEVPSYVADVVEEAEAEAAADEAAQVEDEQNAAESTSEQTAEAEAS
ncbi:MAG: cytochrome c family protein [Pseudomonadota bacterium]